MDVNKSNVAVAENGTILLTSEISVLSTNAIGGGLKANPSDLKHSDAKNLDPHPSMVWAPWGDNDDIPIILKDNIGLIGVLGSGIDINTSMHFGNGIIWGKDSYENNKKIFIPQRVPFWEDLKRSCEIDLIQSELVESLETFYVAFPEIILNNGKYKVHSVKILDPVYSRYERRDEFGKIQNLLYSSDFGQSRVRDFDVIPIYDPTDPYKHQRFVFPVQYRCFGNFYYPEPLYYSCIRNGYADVAIAVPKMLKSIYENQMTIKYIIRVPIAAMRRKYIMWDTPPNCDTTEQVMEWQLQKMVELQTEINDHLTKPENAYKGLFTFSDDKNESDKGIEIEPIKSYLESSKELPNAAAANYEFLFALQVDPAQIGLGIPGGKMLSGSGSDKRESREIKQASQKRERIVSLRLPNLLASLNKIDAEVYPNYSDTDTSQTLDQNPTGKQTVVQA